MIDAPAGPCTPGWSVGARADAAWSMGYSGGQNVDRPGELRVVEAFSVIFSPHMGWLEPTRTWIMSLIRVCTGGIVAAGILMLAALGGAGDYLAPGAYAAESTQKKKPRRYSNRQ